MAGQPVSGNADGVVLPEARARPQAQLRGGEGTGDGAEQSWCERPSWA